VFKAGYIELSKIKGSETQQGDKASWLGDMQSIERALQRAEASETTHLESMVAFLATTGSAAPFVGLFGTVWGIMNSFRAIGEKGAANLATVAPGIAEALIATAIGLMAAIPAVVAYNYFLRRIKVLTSEMDAFSNDFLNITKRHFFK
jgi:biopolymer transport protein TolQ